MIPVTRPWLPARASLDKYIDGIYERRWLTNNGPLVQTLTERLQQWLGVDNLLLVGNGTLALQIAYRALGVTPPDRQPVEAVTTPFSFIATASSLRWEGIDPVFADIDSHTWCLDPEQAAKAITPATRAIVPVHVFGNACDVAAFDQLARAHQIRLIYDGAHAFGVQHAGKSLLSYGDACTLSFHATKLFHSIEGGAIIFRHEEDLHTARQMINFGITGPDSIGSLGINAKMNEFQAAMGLCVLDELDQQQPARAETWNSYHAALKGKLTLQRQTPQSTCNHAYFPLLLDSEAELLHCMQALTEHGIQTRRYFHPSLDSLDWLNPGPALPVSRDVSSRVLCLPLFADLPPEQAETIARLLLTSRADFHRAR
ncbi:MAG: DegT/DnrJ/EryC1/StrS family aminotransferase [Pseudomonadaceae bacterium]